MKTPAFHSTDDDPSFIEFVHILYREPQRKVRWRHRRLEKVQGLGNGGAFIPVHAFGLVNDHIPLAGRHRNNMGGRDPDFVEISVNLGLDFIEPAF